MVTSLASPMSQEFTCGPLWKSTLQSLSHALILSSVEGLAKTSQEDSWGEGKDFDEKILGWGDGLVSKELAT